MDNNTDIYPPSKVIDVNVVQSNLNDVSQGFLLTFSAPGDDYDSGTGLLFNLLYIYNNLTPPQSQVS